MEISQVDVRYSTSLRPLPKNTSKDHKTNNIIVRHRIYLIPHFPEILYKILEPVLISRNIPVYCTKKEKGGCHQ